MATVIEDTKNRIRDLPISARLRALLEGAASAVGIDIVLVFSGGQAPKGSGGKRTGSTRHDHGNAADLKLIVDGRTLNFTRKKDRRLVAAFVTAAAAAGATGIGAGKKYMGPESLHVGYGKKAIWGAKGKSANAPGWLVKAVRAGWKTAAAGVGIMPAFAAADDSESVAISDLRASVDPSKPLPVSGSKPGRDADLSKLHPVVRDKVNAIQDELQQQNIPLAVFEAYRSPLRQAHLFAQGRTKPGGIVTYANAWQSYHQYGMAVDFVIRRDGGWSWDTSTSEARGWWDRYHEIAVKHGMETLSFETPHCQIAGYTYQQLLSGSYPAGGDESWYSNLSREIEDWPYAYRPDLDGGVDRPPLSETTMDWGDLPQVEPIGWHSRFGGMEWRVDERGIYLRGAPNTPLRTPGQPLTCMKIVDLYGDDIAAFSEKWGIPPEILVMTIAVETAAYRKVDFTGPKTFRWEAHTVLPADPDLGIPAGEKGDYSAGPMQITAKTGRATIVKPELDYDKKATFPFYKNKPSPVPAKHAMYGGTPSLDIGAAIIADRLGTTGFDPILIAAVYNAGSIKMSNNNLWKIHVHGTHLDRAAEWFGDACAVIGG